MRKRLVLSVLALSAAPTLYSAYLASAIIGRGYDWREMDWNSNGRTELHEVLAAGDIVPHRTLRGGQRCTHYFAYSSATLVRSDCETDV
jgi:hypothetical protein